MTTGALTFGLASLLIVAHRKLAVPEDPRIDAVEAMLPLAQCGACGLPGCRPFAEALVAGTASPGGCTVSSDGGRARIAALLGVDVGAVARRVARLACAGGTNVARDRAVYSGPRTCAAAATAGGGPKACTWGCIGFADCDVACSFDAISMNAHGLPVVDEDLCTACGDCVDACPKDLFSLHPVTHKLWVACSSLAHGDDQLADCEVACTACGRCAMDSPAVTMQNSLPVIDQGRRPTAAAIERCPTGAIVWFEADGPRKGVEAAPVIRVGPRAPASS
jgi:electron transport complex protein RnfB